MKSLLPLFDKVYKFLGLRDLGRNGLVNKSYKAFIDIILISFNASALCYVLLWNIRHFQEYSFNVLYVLAAFSVGIKRWILKFHMPQVEKIEALLIREELHPAKIEHFKILDDGIKLSKIIFYFHFGNHFATSSGIIILHTFLQIDDKFIFYEDWVTRSQFVAIFVFQSLFLLYSTLSNFIVDVLFVVLSIQIGTQCEVVAKRLASLKYTDNNGKTLRNDLTNCIVHYQLLIELSGIVGHVFSYIALVQFAMSMLAICLTLFSLAVEPLLGMSSVLIMLASLTFISEIFLYCYFGNYIVWKSEEVNNSIAMTRWYKFPQDIKKDLLFLIHRTQKPIILTGASLFPINLRTFVMIVKSSWAYFMALYSTTFNYNI